MKNEEFDRDKSNTLNEEAIQLLEDRRRKRLSGESKTYSWEEAKKIITGISIGQLKIK